MLLDWLHGDLHHWAIFCCVVASLGLVGAAWFAVGICFGKGALSFLNGSGRQPQVIVVNGPGRYVAQPQKRTWSLGRTYLLFAAIFSGGPMLTLLVMAGDHAAWYVVDWVRVNWWLLPVVGVAVVLVVAFWLLVRRDRRVEVKQVAELHALPAVVERAPIWTAPTYEGKWAEKS